jgi:KDO2-lipid IV(A) lauroyltransferase
MRRRNGFLDIQRTGKGDGVRAILKRLAAGEMIGFVLDQSRPGEPRLPFFGKPASTNTGLAALWLRRPAPVVPCWIERVGFGQHRLHVLPALEMKPSGSAKQNGIEIMETSRFFNTVLESMIAQRPEQYLWMHRRWK